MVKLADPFASRAISGFAGNRCAKLDRRRKNENKRPMSAHGEPHDDAHDHDAADHDDQHAPPPPEEPRTPLWLTLLGIGLFLIGGLALAASRGGGKTTAELVDAATPSASVAALPPN